MEEQKIQQLNRFKIEKENTIQYPIKELLKDSINDWILSDIQQINMKLGQELRLISKVNNKDDIKRLKCFVKNNKSNLPLAGKNDSLAGDFYNTILIINCVQRY